MVTSSAGLGGWGPRAGSALPESPWTAGWTVRPQDQGPYGGAAHVGLLYPEPTQWKQRPSPDGVKSVAAAA
jgi:hypothetical protein